MALAGGTGLLRAHEKRMIVVLMGPPGSGKSTQSAALKKRYGWPTVGMSDLLREEVAKGTPEGKQIQAAMSKGVLVPDSEVNRLLKARLQRDDAKNGLVLDGYPRTLAQAKYLVQLEKEIALPQLLVVHLDVPVSVALGRMDERGRADDKPDVIEKRMKDYYAQTKSLLEYFGKRVRSIDGAQKPEQVTAAIVQALEK